MAKARSASIVRQLSGVNHDMVGIHVFLGGVTTLEELARRVLEELVREGWDQPWYARISNLLGDRVKRVGALGITIEFSPEPEDLTLLAHRFPEILGEFVARIAEDRSGVLIILDDINGLTEDDLFANWYKSAVDQIATQFGSYPALVLLSGIPERRDQLSVQQPSLMRVFRIVELERLSDPEVEDFFDKAVWRSGNESEGRRNEVNGEAFERTARYDAGDWRCHFLDRL